MKVIQIVSESKDGSRMEVIAKEEGTRHTLHLCKVRGVWNYFVGLDKKERKVFSPIIV